MQFTDSEVKLLREAFSFFAKKHIVCSEDIQARQELTKSEVQSVLKEGSQLQKSCLFTDCLDLLQNADITSLKTLLLRGPIYQNTYLCSFYTTCREFRNISYKPAIVDLQLGKISMLLKIDLQKSKFCIEKPEYKLSSTWLDFNKFQSLQGKLEEIYEKQIAYDLFRKFCSVPENGMSMQEKKDWILLFQTFATQKKLQLPPFLGSLIGGILLENVTCDLNSVCSAVQNDMNESKLALIKLLKPGLVEILLPNVNTVENVQAIQADLSVYDGIFVSTEEFTSHVYGIFELSENQQRTTDSIYQSLKYDKEYADDFKVILKKIFVAHRSNSVKSNFEILVFLADAYGLNYKIFNKLAKFIDKLDECLKKLYVSIEVFECEAQDILFSAEKLLQVYNNNPFLQIHLSQELVRVFNNHLTGIDYEQYVEFLGAKYKELKTNIDNGKFNLSYGVLFRDIKLFKMRFMGVVFSEVKTQQFTSENCILYMRAIKQYEQETKIGKKFAESMPRPLVLNNPYIQATLDRETHGGASEFMHDGTVSKKQNSFAINNKQSIAVAGNNKRRAASRMFFVFGGLLVALGVIFSICVSLLMGIGLIVTGVALVSWAGYRFYKNSKSNATEDSFKPEFATIVNISKQVGCDPQCSFIELGTGGYGNHNNALNLSK